MTTSAPPTRGRGRPPRVSRESIIEAARGIAPELLSMQSVADRLGVDRSTINYHFTDRDELFSQVASSAFGTEMAGYVAPESEDWRDWVTSYGEAVHRALLQHPEFAGHVRLAFGSNAEAFGPVEGLIRILSNAGFDERAVVQSIAYLSEVVHAAVRNEIEVANGGHPQGVELARFLGGQPREAMPGIRRIMELDPLAHEEHFAFAMRMVVAGMESLLPARL
jgi:TetR/AcrR family transcriptional regulator, tetracycline repressor protein